MSLPRDEDVQQTVQLMDNSSVLCRCIIKEIAAGDFAKSEEGGEEEKRSRRRCSYRRLPDVSM